MWGTNRFILKSELKLIDWIFQVVKFAKREFEPHLILKRFCILVDPIVIHYKGILRYHIDKSHA
jgi:hypothetical protein